MNASLIYLAGFVFVGIGLLLQGRSLKDDVVIEKYDEIKGSVVKFARVIFGLNHYAWVMGYKLGDEFFGVKCLAPKFTFICKYEGVRLGKKER